MEWGGVTWYALCVSSLVGAIVSVQIGEQHVRNPQKNLPLHCFKITRSIFKLLIVGVIR